MASPYLDEDRERRRKALKIQRSLRKETSLDPMSGSDTDDVDFTKEIHPIGYYIEDREKMIEEMFSILKGEKLQRILPALLKDYTIEELKADCLVHLLGMSKKRIFAILEGRDLNSSSDSETEDEAENEHKKSHSKSNSPDVELSKPVKRGKEEPRRAKKRKASIREDKKLKKQNSPCIVISDDELLVEDLKPLQEERKTIIKLRKERRVLKAKIEKKMKKNEKRKFKSRLQDIQVIEDSNDDEARASKSDSDHEDEGKSLLEILELEMRARAIRALLKNTPNYEEPVPVSILNMKPEPDFRVETEINKTIAEVISEKSPLDKSSSCDPNSSVDDVEISEVCDIITLTIDDDDDINIDLTATEKLNEKEAEVKNAVVEEPENEKSKTAKSDASVRNSTETDDNPETNNHTSDKKDKDNVTWSDRWAQSKGVTEVLKSNKLCANIRKRMRFARMLREKQSQAGQVKETDGQQEEILSSLNNVEESSVAQYELIKSLDRLKSTTEESTSSEDKVEPCNAESGADEGTSTSCHEKLTTVGEPSTEELPTIKNVVDGNACDIPLPVADNEIEENNCINLIRR